MIKSIIIGLIIFSFLGIALRGVALWYLKINGIFGRLDNISNEIKIIKEWITQQQFK